MNIEEQIRYIKGQLRLAMNGIVAQSMRDKGICYKLNFGVSLPELQAIANGVEHSHQLAMSLWKEDIRECKMLAAMTEPAEDFPEELADMWVGMTDYPDLAEVCCKYLYERLPYASGMAFRWIASDREITQYCGFLILIRLLRGGRQMSPGYIDELMDQCQAAIASDSALVIQAANSVLGLMEEHSPEQR